jgi:hypothetical protein
MCPGKRRVVCLRSAEVNPLDSGAGFQVERACTALAISIAWAFARPYVSLASPKRGESRDAETMMGSVSVVVSGETAGFAGAVSVVVSATQARR